MCSLSHALACHHTKEKGTKVADNRHAIPPSKTLCTKGPTSHCLGLLGSNPLEALSGRKKTVTLSCFSLSWAVMQMWDWGCPGCLWISRLLNTMIRDDSLSLSHTLNGSVNSLTWIIAVIVASHSWGAATRADSTTRAPTAVLGRAAVTLGLKPCPYPSEVILSHQVKQRKRASLGHIWQICAEISLQECFAYYILIVSD